MNLTRQMMWGSIGLNINRPVFFGKADAFASMFNFQVFEHSGSGDLIVWQKSMELVRAVLRNDDPAAGSR